MIDASSWFVVLPDDSTADAVCVEVRAHAPREIAHPSGRPWIVGGWPDGAVSIGQAGSTKVAVFGQHAVTSRELAHAAGHIRTVADVDRLAKSLAGSFHLAVSVDGRVRLQGTLVGVRRVYRTRLAGTTIAADRADVLARITRAGLDERRFAFRLLDFDALYPLAGRPVWAGVELVPADHYLVMDGQISQTVRRWMPPGPVVPMAEGAGALREALGAAVDVRVRGRERVSTDLGGLDSTALCSLAARSTAHVVAYTADTYDPHGDDVRWAGRTVAGLGNVEHHIVPAAEMPVAYQGVLDQFGPFDEPCTSAIDLNRSLTVTRRARERGSRLHLSGFGGDELLYGSVAHLHSLIRKKPLAALRDLRGFAAKYRWPARLAVRQLLDGRTYQNWLRVVADELTAPAEPIETPLLDWGFKPRMPPWATRTTVDAVRELIRAEARVAEPHSRLRGQHRELETMRSLAGLVRQYEQLAAGLGMAFAAPYYDDHVIEAGLAVRPEDRITPWTYKPLIIEAMRGIVPDDSLQRQTKATANFEEWVGVRQHRAELLTLCDESRLGALGLIDVDAFREACSLPPVAQEQLGSLHQTVACELWLRALEDSNVHTGKGGDGVAVA